MLPCYLYQYFKPAEAREEKGRTAKEIFDRKPDRRPDDRHGNGRFQSKGTAPRGDRPYPPKKKY